MGQVIAGGLSVSKHRGMGVSRRTFLSTCAVGSVWWGGGAKTSLGYVAGEAIRVGIIGYGGRCRALVAELLKMPGVKIVAVCDVFESNRLAAAEMAGSGAFVTGDHRALLDRPEVDAVLIATPDHLHVPISIDACRAGKHIYVEKPLTHDLEEGKAIIQAEKESKVIIQVGMQQRSMPHLQEAREIVRSGELGTVRKVHLSWNRNQPRGSREIRIEPSLVDWKRFLGGAREQPFDAYRMVEWRWFWDFGGGIFTDLMVHWMDVVNWYLDLPEPSSAAAIGNHFLREGMWETPDTVQTLVSYPNPGVQVHFEGTFVNHRQRAMTEFMGTKGTLYIDRGRYEFHPENEVGTYREKILGQGVRGADFYKEPPGEKLHLEDWLSAIREGRPTRCPATAGVQAVLASHLSNQSLRSGEVARWRS
jgi:predicted dehydrogenase